jgi:hypothetical protein
MQSVWSSGAIVIAGKMRAIFWQDHLVEGRRMHLDLDEIKAFAHCRRASFPA